MAIEHSHQSTAAGGLTLDEQAMQALAQSVRAACSVRARMASTPRDTCGTG